MAELLSLWLIVAVFTLCSCGQFGQAAVQFNFSRSTVTISENGNLPSELSIIKTGENVMDISFRVIVNPGTAQETTDYVANDNDPYVFTSTTRQLPIRTTLMTDRAGESVEQFTICLPDQTVLSSIGAEAVEPTCATINIIDDDSVVIGFANTSLEFMEAGGPAQKVCVEVKALGLGLDPFDRVPLNINANDSQVQLSGNSLLFDMGITIRCVTVSVVDNNNIADGDRSVSLTITSGGSSSVPVELYPNTILVDIVDDDRVTFTFVPQRSFTVLEGDTFDSLEIQKSGATTLTFRVTLRVELITKSGSSTDSNNLVVNPMTLLFNPSTTQMPFEIQLPNNPLSEMQKQFNISLDRIETTSGVGALVTSGEPITIIVYDNDFEIGFTDSEERILIPEGSSKGVCIAIRSPMVIYPSVNIGVSVSVVNLTFVEGNLELETNMVVLNATNPEACIVVRFPINNQQCDRNSVRDFALQLFLTTDSNARYSINIHQDNTTVTIIDDSQDCSHTSNSALAAIVLLPVAIIMFIIVIILIIFLRRKKIKMTDDSQPLTHLSGREPAETTGKQPPTAQTSDEEPPTAQTSDVQPPTAQTNDEEPPTAQSSDVQPPTAQSSDEQPPTAQTSDEQPPTAQTSDEQPPTAQTSDEEPPTAQTSDVQPPTAQTNDEEPPTAQSSDEQPPTAQTSDEQPPTAQTSDEQPPTAQTSDEQPPTAQFSDEQPPSEQSTRLTRSEEVHSSSAETFKDQP